jgi:hypothetical protein
MDAWRGSTLRGSRVAYRAHIDTGLCLSIDTSSIPSAGPAVGSSSALQDGQQHARASNDTRRRFCDISALAIGCATVVESVVY